MGFEAERAEELADMYEAGLINLDGSPVEDAPKVSNFDVADEPGAGSKSSHFDTPDTADETAAVAPQPVVDLARPEAVRGRYILPHPATGARTTWQRVSNKIKLAEDTYHLELWKQRNVVAGLVADPELYDAAQGLQVKADKAELNKIVERSMDAAGAYAMSNEGTRLHKSAEIADFAGGSLAGVPDRHRTKIALYLGALREYGLTVVPDMIERVTVSVRWNVAGKFDRVCSWRHYGNVIVDLKTGDELDMSFPSISAQLACYEDGVNQAGIYDGRRYDPRVKVRHDVGVVIHLPSTRDEVSVWIVDLNKGREILRVCEEVQGARKIKGKDVARMMLPAPVSVHELDTEALNAGYIERMNAVHSYDDLMALSLLIRGRGQWNERLASVARGLASELAL